MSSNIEIKTKEELLLPVIKDTLFYSWTDDATERRLLDIIRDGVRYFERLASGNTLTFNEGTDERRLLKSFCIYADSGALDEFLENNLSEIVSFQYTQEVLAYGETEEDPTVE